MQRNYIAKRFQSAGTGLTLDTEALAKYKDIVDLSIGDTDFTTVSGHIVSLFRRKPGDTAAQRLKLALLMRNTYTDIFRHLI